ncbi:expressed unknown protein [Ectocarpus siliculosus]|uniref:Uncharacterized protein n=1 Tax=Ectocarpus siliculosus TaxID=2880 RepID=D7FZF5_ECTSI|nr:expressed unknown protein [Ectocarpus siliculosus]|eukprot:CBJ32772.1 expressed unknown protein [Ectocarpus siliculosus]
MIRLTAREAWAERAVDGGGGGGGGCRDEGLASLHAFMLPAVMDVCPELFCPEQRGNSCDDNHYGDAVDGTAVVEAPSGSFVSGQEITPHPLDKAFVRRATGAVVAAPGGAVDVLRALLACPVPALLSTAEDVLKGVLPKVAGPDFPRRSSVASLCCNVWMRLYDAHPHGQAMETWTLNALLQTDAEAPLPRAVTYETMCREPVLVFRCRGEAVLAKNSRWEMVCASARRRNDKAASEAAAAAAAAATAAAAAAAASAAAAGGPPPPPPPPPPPAWEDVEEGTATVDGRMMSLVQQAIVARCLLVVALGGAGVSGGGSAKEEREGGVVVFGDGIATRAQTLPTEAFKLLLDGVPASRGTTRHLGDVMGQQSWEARAFGVQASALLAERFPTEEACLLCKGALHVLSSMCDSEAQAPRGTLNALAAGSAAAGGGGGGGGGGAGNGGAPSTALLACGMPPSGLVRETFSFAVNICQAFPSLKGDTVSLIESILKKQVGRDGLGMGGVGDGVTTATCVGTVGVREG